jgi:hypothetical protein
VGNAAPIHDPCASAFDAHTRPAQGFAHFSERAGSVVQLNRQVFHNWHRQRSATGYAHRVLAK